MRREFDVFGLKVKFNLLFTHAPQRPHQCSLSRCNLAYGNQGAGIPLATDIEIAAIGRQTGVHHCPSVCGSVKLSRTSIRRRDLCPQHTPDTPLFPAGEAPNHSL